MERKRARALGVVVLRTDLSPALSVKAEGIEAGCSDRAPRNIDCVPSTRGDRPLGTLSLGGNSYAIGGKSASKTAKAFGKQAKRKAISRGDASASQVQRATSGCHRVCPEASSGYGTIGGGYRPAGLCRQSISTGSLEIVTAYRNLAILQRDRAPRPSGGGAIGFVARGLNRSAGKRDIGSPLGISTERI
jgi:hypothetical protein